MKVLCIAVALGVHVPPAVQEVQVRFLGQEDPSEEEMTTMPVFVPEKFHEQSSCSPCNCKELDKPDQLSMHARRIARSAADSEAEVDVRTNGQTARNR